MCAAEVSTLSLPFQTPLVAIFIMVKIVILKHYLKKKKPCMIKRSAQSLGLFVLTIPILDGETYSLAFSFMYFF